VVFQSHDHYDHMDFPTLQRVAAEWRPRFLVPLGVRARLASKNIVGGAEATELDWWESTSISSEFEVTAVPARHFSGRGLGDRNKTLWCGYVMDGPSGSVYFAGDTGYGAHFHEIRVRFPRMRLALLPIGAFQPLWFMGQVHMSPGEAVRAHRDLGAGTSVGIHFGTFRLADDGENEPVEELQRALAMAAEPRPRFYILSLGEGREVP
jgi:L-ascorbate metabolism protein UlaG (beta-lactamase superfamily)